MLTKIFFFFCKGHVTLSLLVLVLSALTLAPSLAEPAIEQDDEPVYLADDDLGQLVLDGDDLDENLGEDGGVHELGKRSPSTFSRILRGPSTFSRILRGESSFSRLVYLK